MYGTTFKPRLATQSGGATTDKDNGVTYNATSDDTISLVPLFLKDDRLIERIVSIGNSTTVEYFNPRTQETLTKAQFDTLMPLLEVSKVQAGMGKIAFPEVFIDVTETPTKLVDLLAVAGFVVPANANKVEISPLLQLDATGSNRDYLIHSTDFTPSTTMGTPTEDTIVMETRRQIDELTIVAVPSVLARPVRCMVTFYYVPN